MADITFNGITLRREEKTNWASGHLAAQTIFIHCSTARPRDIDGSGGIDPNFSREWCVDNGGNRIGQGRYVFGFKHLGGQVSIPKAAAKLGFGDNGDHVYVLTLPAQTEFWCTGGVVGNGCETGFPDFIGVNRITTTYRVAGGQLVNTHFAYGQNRQCCTIL